MATDMTREMISPFRDIRTGMALVLCALAFAASAEELPDPTRPPGELGSEVKAFTDGLQTVIISPARRAAIINGQTVELGAKLGDVRLIEVNPSNVVLEGEQGRRVLRLFPHMKSNRETMLPPMKNPPGHPEKGEEK